MIPRIRFAYLPTLVEAMPRLSAALGGPQLLVKRDDLTGLAFGGNKTRKLEFLLAEAQAQGARTLITAGAVQSNHCRQTAAAAARFGFECILVLTGEEPASPSGNMLLDRLFGAQIVWAGEAGREATLQQVVRRAQEVGQRPHLIPFGGSSPTGAAAFAYALEELIEQGVRPDWIIFATSSGGTQAGLVAGVRRFGFQGQILGISIDEPAPVLRERVAELAGRTAELIGEKASFSADDILVNADYLGGGYGVMGSGEQEALHLFARQEGLLLDPVYTGRAAAGLIDLVRQGFFSPNETVLFWHTGGGPALFADRYREMLLQ
ncbi:MAG: pyridoxal-5'-phosphate-dependent protein [Chloroflexi bacterium RBG_19FT_COMBO_55_16]|nr:MAG: pyridoxal-5'-phosphate-dependent protein [Chloroflexi bacterium RBG_19FT_COMBO_55_16]